MPIPEPNSNEEREQYLSRCTAFLIDEGKPSEQAYAICVGEWENKKNMKGKNLVEFKNFNLKDAQIDEQSRRVSGYFAAFNNIDSDQDVILKGAFARSISERGPQSNGHQKIAYLWMHEMNNPIGKLLKLEEDDFGLYFEAEIDDIPEGDRALKQYASGTLNQHSIGYEYVWEKCEWGEFQGKEAFICGEMKLYEGSVVTVGSNHNTPFTGFKGKTIDEQLKELDESIKLAVKGIGANKEYEIKTLFEKHKHLISGMADKLTKKEMKPQTFDFISELSKTKIF